MRSRRRREPALRMFSEEINHSHLHQKGTGEFDPSYVISRLGARANRVIVAGLVERIERRDNESGASYNGILTDPLGRTYFQVGSFQEDVLDISEELVSRHEEGESLLLMIVGKTRHWASPEDGSVYISLRPEEIATIDRDRYADWILETAEHTLGRMQTVHAVKEMEPNYEALESAGIRENDIQPLLDARAFYGDRFDPDSYALGILRALDMIGSGATLEPPKNAPMDDEVSIDDQVLRDHLIRYVTETDGGKGVDHESIVRAGEGLGASRSQAEEMLETLTEEGILWDREFGWYRVVEESDAS